MGASKRLHVRVNAEPPSACVPRAETRLTQAAIRLDGSCISEVAARARSLVDKGWTARGLRAHVSMFGLRTRRNVVERRTCEAMKDSYLANGVTVAQVAALFDVARELWAAAPWNVILTDDALIRVSCASLDLEDAVISVIGQHREMFGFVLFPEGLDAYTQFEKAARQGMVPMQTQVSLTYVNLRDLSVHLRREVQKFRWPPVEGLYALVTTVDRNGPRPASSAEVVRVEAIASALSELVRIEPCLQDVTFGIGSFEHTLEVSTFSGRRELRVSAPCIPLSDGDDELVFVRSARTKSSRDGNRSQRS